MSIEKVEDESSAKEIVKKMFSLSHRNDLNVVGLWGIWLHQPLLRC